MTRPEFRCFLYDAHSRRMKWSLVRSIHGHIWNYQMDWEGQCLLYGLPQLPKFRVSVLRAREWTIAENIDCHETRSRQTLSKTLLPKALGTESTFRSRFPGNRIARGTRGPLLLPRQKRYWTHCSQRQCLAVVGWNHDDRELPGLCPRPRSRYHLPGPVRSHQARRPPRQRRAGTGRGRSWGSLTVVAWTLAHG